MSNPEIRAARMTDIPAIRALAQKAYFASSFADKVNLDLEALNKVLISVIGQQSEKPGKGLVVVGEDETGKIRAIFAGLVSPLYECLTALMATNVIWYAEKGCSAHLSLGVFDHFMEWVEQSSQPVLHRYVISDAIVPNHHAVGALLVRKRGFRVAGGLYEKGI